MKYTKLLFLSPLFACLVACANNETKCDENVQSEDLPSIIQQSNILHCFSWSYNQIKEELPGIAEAGFGTVQTSPVQNADGGAWYWLYQPYDFACDSNALGTRAELQALCEEADKYGIKVIVDMVANHLNGYTDKKLADRWKNCDDCWHHHDRRIDFSDRKSVTDGALGMRDLNSENPKVYNAVADFIKDLANMGVDGFRWDASKHIALPSEGCEFWPIVTDNDLFHYGEMLGGPIDGNDSLSTVLMNEYIKYIRVTDSGYGDGMRNALKDGKIYKDSANWVNRGIAPDKLIYWAESHDTYSNGGWGSQNISQDLIDKVYALVASRESETALYFSRPLSKDRNMILSGTKGSTHYSVPQVAEVNKFRNAMRGQKDCYTYGDDVMAVCREQGAVVVKLSEGAGQVQLANPRGLTAAGTYEDRISGNKWQVTQSQIIGETDSLGIAVLYLIER